MEIEHADVAGLAVAPEVDILTVTFKVPHHFEIVKAAIGAGKHVCCESPLGNGLTAAEDLTLGVLSVAGTSARVAPDIVI
jgi:predicted dehydrogenase